MKNIHLIKTDKPSRLHLWTDENGTRPALCELEYSHTRNTQHIYITSYEEIKEGDYRLNIQRDYFKKSDKEGLDYYNKRNDVFKKVILTTDQDLIKDGVQAIDDEFLEWYVQNPSCEEVEVVDDLIITQDKPLIQHQGSKPIVVPHRIGYKIIIPKEETTAYHYLSCCRSIEECHCGKYPKQIKCYCGHTIMCDCSPIDEPKDVVLGYKTSLDAQMLDKIEPKQEIWKDIPDYEGLYQVSNFGNVKSLERYVKGKVENRLQKENILSKRLVGDIGNQYYAVTLCNNKNRKQVKVSVLVAMAFLNHIPNGYVGFTVDHIDNNPLNNNVNNLQVITKRENSSKDKKGISKYTGVTFNKKTNKWRSQIWINGKNKTLGSFDDELEAHRVYQKELQQYLKSQ